jgi:hypothetical protein
VVGFIFYVFKVMGIGTDGRFIFYVFKVMGIGTDGREHYHVLRWNLMEPRSLLTFVAEEKGFLT